jgi:hypothetical protein
MKNTIVAMAASILISGCIPFTVAESPKITARIVDAESRAPLTAARVFVKDRPETAVVADSNGYVDFSSVRDSKWLPALPFDIIPSVLPLIVEAPGYLPVELTSEVDGFHVRPMRDIIVELRK